MAMNLGKLFETMKKGMTDDKGLFQGGQEGRLFGRARDAAVSMDPSAEEDRSLAVQARDFAKNFDASDSDQVLEMQNMLNQLGFKDDSGEALMADGMMGNKTLAALRQLQGVTNEDDNSSVETAPNESYDYEPGKDPMGPVQGGSYDPEAKRVPDNTVASNMAKLFGTGGLGSGGLIGRDKY
tara:strand:+ start:1116 stop:1661 length:546 start_codon:yes stop_codon:yes gene_type:complete